MDINWPQNTVERQFISNKIASLSERLNVLTKIEQTHNFITQITDANDINCKYLLNTPTQLYNEILLTKFFSLASNEQNDRNVVVAQNANILPRTKQKHIDHVIHHAKCELKDRSMTKMSSETSLVKKCITSNNNNDINEIKIKATLTTAAINKIKNHHHHNTKITTTTNNNIDLDIKSGLKIPKHNCDFDAAERNEEKESTSNYRYIDPQITTNLTVIKTTNSCSNDVEHDSPVPNNFKIIDEHLDRTRTCRTSFANHIKLKQKNRCWKALNIIICYLFLLSSSFRICVANKNEVSNCTFPQRWEGSWFLSGNQQPIYIKGNTLSFRGRCMASDGDKFLIVDDKGCHRCLVIYEKHKNVLQYKESECEGDSMFMDQSNPAAMSIQQMRSTILKSDHKGGAHPNIRLLSSSDQYSSRSNDDNNDNYYCKGRETLQNLCEQIAGDALLYSLFKVNAEPVKCPLRGPFTFTYNRGHGECKNPVSNIESCTEDSRLLLNLQACPDVAGTESTVEELTCLATWKDGNSRYLVGLVSHHHAVSNEERYRCFVYEKILSNNDETTKDAEYKLAQSGDATCNGLDSAEVGSRIMTLRRSPPAERCDFPTWFKGPKHWHSLADNNQYVYHQSDGSMHVLKSNGHMETRALCEQINKQTSTESQVIAHQTTGCQSGFMCMVFYRRDTHIAEIQMGVPASRLEDACTVDNFDVAKLPYVTLVATTVDPQECPLNGLYGLRGAIGPPYISSRHKRNHNRAHHHRHDVPNKRFVALSFRNPEEFSKLDWQMKSRATSFRSRRELQKVSDATTSQTSLARTTNNEDQPLTTKETSQIDLSSKRSQSNNQRLKRDTSDCVINYSSARQLLIGCSQPNMIEVKPHCNDDGDEVYGCQGAWSDNTTTYIVATHSGSQHAVCITYQTIDATTVSLFVSDSCYRPTLLPSSDHHLAANLTIIGKCTDVSSAVSNSVDSLVFCVMILFTIIISNRTR